MTNGGDRRQALRGSDAGNSGPLSDAIAVAVWPEHPASPGLDLPEHPDDAVPRPTTTIKNIDVSAGAVSMFNIPQAEQTTCQR